MGAVEIVSEHVHRLLAYIAALNRNGVRPERQLIEEFAKRPERRSPTRRSSLTLIAEQMALVLGGVEVSEGETYCDYLARLGWIDDKQQVELTSVGRALLKALNTPVLEETTADVFEIVLEPEDPFAYAKALGALGGAKRSLLVEPYFRLQQLIDIEAFDNIERVLIGPGVSGSDLKVLAVGLAGLDEGRNLEVRRAKALHDRYLIPHEGAVTMLGMSLGGIGKKVSTITTLGEVASIALRDAHEHLWREAEVVEPKTAPLRAPAGDSVVERARSKTAAPAKQADSKEASSSRGETQQ